jgi:hypothetical protein
VPTVLKSGSLILLPELPHVSIFGSTECAHHHNRQEIRFSHTILVRKPDAKNNFGDLNRPLIREGREANYAFRTNVIIIINIQSWAIWPVPSPELQLLSPTFLRSSKAKGAQPYRKRACLEALRLASTKLTQRGTG